MGFYRDTYIEIDLDAIEHNLTQINLYHQKKYIIMAVVKADAYGHGAVHVARAALSAGAKYLAVATLDEALELRGAGIESPILIFGRIRPRDLHLASRHKLTITVHCLNWLEEAIKTYRGDQINVHIKVETGMNRLGLTCLDEFISVYQTLNQSKHFKVEGIYSHLANSESSDDTYYQYQIANFERLISEINPENLFIHIANSGGSIKVQPPFINMLRIGLFLYGLKPREDLLLPFDLKEALRLYSTLVQVKLVPPSSRISYHGIYQTKATEIIGTIPIGYADGYDRRMKEGQAFIEGEYHPVVGRICMDFSLLHLSKAYPVGTKVELIGPHIPIDQYAKSIDTINYQAVCELSDRIPRLYYKGGQTIDIINRRLEFTRNESSI